MSRYYWPLSPEQDRDVRQRVARRLLERHRDNWDTREDEMPILKRPSGRERLAQYRTTDQAWWEQIASTYPEEARRLARDWASLSKRYGPPIMAPQMQVAM